MPRSWNASNLVTCAALDLDAEHDWKAGYPVYAGETETEPILMTLLEHNLPGGLPAAQVRSALTAVIRRQLSVPGNFDRDGWLTVGFSGHQLHMSEPYINTGSEYLCCAVFLPLGLPAEDPFWADPAREWTGLRAWKGEDVGADHAIRDLDVVPQRDLLQQN